jgi:acyl-CoA thioester hydrolase
VNASHEHATRTAEREPTRAELASVPSAALQALLVPHWYEIDVLYEDTDATGAVYHPNYLKFLDRARARLLGPRLLRSIRVEYGVGFVIHKAALDFVAPAHFGDVLRIETRLCLSTAYKLDFAHRIHLQDSAKLVVTATVRVVCVRADGVPIPVPLDRILEAVRMQGTSLQVDP